LLIFETTKPETESAIKTITKIKIELLKYFSIINPSFTEAILVIKYDVKPPIKIINAAEKMFYS